MGIVSGFVVFVMIWWTVIFCVLPIGQATEYEEQGSHAAPGSPRHLNIRRKLFITTVISVILWVVAYFLIEADLVSFREMAKH